MIRRVRAIGEGQVERGLDHIGTGMQDCSTLQDMTTVDPGWSFRKGAMDDSDSGSWSDDD